MDEKKLKQLGLTDEQIKSVLDAHNGIIDKTNANHKALEEENSNLKAQITERDSLIGEFEKNKTDVEALNKRIEEYKTLEQNYKAQIEDNNLNNVVRDIIEQKQYVNEITKKGLSNSLKEAIKDKANAGKSAIDLFNNIIKDMTDIFKAENNSQNITQPQVIIPSTNTGSGSNKLYSREQLENMTTEEINKNWELVSQSLKEAK